MCPLFFKFHDLGDFVKVMSREYSKFHAIFSVLLRSASKKCQN